MADHETTRTFRRIRNDLRRALRDAQEGAQEIRDWLNRANRHEAEQDHAANVLAQMSRIERLAAHALATVPDDPEDALAVWNDYFPAIEFIADRADGADPVPQIFAVNEMPPPELRPRRRLA